MSNFKCDEIDPDAPEGEVAPYWAPDEAMRLECLRLAMTYAQRSGASAVVSAADDFYAFVHYGARNYAELIDTLESRISLSASAVAGGYAEKARAAGKEDAATVADHIAELLFDTRLREGKKFREARKA